jgi:Protein of unknown function (DUF2752)
VQSTAPIIYTRADRPQLSPPGVRLIALAIALADLAVLIMAASLPPSHSGVATHRGLGLPPCEFMLRTGLPCPSCGMTTSFAWFVRGNLAASLYVQPMGTLLAALTCGCIWASLYIAITGRPIYRLLELAPGRYLYLPLLVIGVAAWAWKIFIHLTGRDGW